MIECALAWILLFVGIISQNANYFIASGVFAVALHLYRMRKGGDE